MTSPSDMAKLFQQLTETLKKISDQNANPDKQNSNLFATINSQLSEFTYNPETDSIFEIWYERFGPFLESDGQSLPDDMQTRLLVGKLGAQEYARYAESILPQKPTEISFQDTVVKLKGLFCGTKSIFVKRFECFQLQKAPAQSPVDFAAQVSASCERAQMSLTKEEIKSLIFISGLDSGDRDLRERCLKMLEEDRAKNTTIKFARLVEECRAVLSLRSAAAALEHPGQNMNTNAISIKPQRERERQGRSRKFSQSSSRREQFSRSQSRTRHGSVRQLSKQRPPHPCKWCKADHWNNECDKRPKCYKCNRLGHISRDCRNKGRNSSNDSMSVMNVSDNTDGWITLDCSINGKTVSLVADTAARKTIIQSSVWEQLGSPKFKTGKTYGKSYSGHQFELIGSFDCIVEFSGKKLQLECFVAPSGALNLFGLPWIRAFESALQRPIATSLDIVSAEPTFMTSISSSELANELKQKFPDVFRPELGHCTKMRAHLYIKSDAKPVFCRPRPVPHGAIDIIDAELDRLLTIGAIKQIDYSRWAAPIVAVKKKSGDVRVCIDFSTGLNDALELNRHPLPRPDDIFNAVRGATVFSQIDFKDAYLQVELDDQSKQLVGLNTHKGLFQYQRLPFGIKSAPSIFQKLMDELVAGIHGVFVYLDDFIVATNSVKTHEQTLFKFFSRLQEWGLRVKLEKCKFLCEELKFLGHIISADGIRPDPERSRIIKELPAPKDEQTLRSFLGAINYYSRFVKQMREIRTPLDELLKKDVQWHWGHEQQQVFEKAKQIITSDLLLTHYDPAKPIIVAADASNYGIGACISHSFANGSEKVVEHASRSLTPAERNYSQIEKEALAIIFAVQKFHRMLYGRKFTLLTDHKPLLSIFGSKNGIPIYTASRLQRWALILSNYDFSIKYISTKNFGQVDVLSRLITQHRDTLQNEDKVIASAQCSSLDDTDDDKLEFCTAAVEYVLHTTLDQLPVTATEIAEQVQNDTEMQQILRYCRNGWPKTAYASPISAYFTHRAKISEVNGCLLMGDRVIIPPSLRFRILTALHFTHPGIVRMKSLAKEFVYWPKIGLDIERWVRNCADCTAAAKAPPKVPLQPWPTSTEVYERLHMDFAGPCSDGNKYLVVIDSYSKWPEVIKMKSTTALMLIDQLVWLFSRYGYPKEIVTDNGPPFKSFEISQFCRKHGIKQTFTPPFHPQSNGRAERFVDTLKRQMTKCSRDDPHWVQNSLLAYRSTPNASLNGHTPAEFFLGRPVRTVLSLVKPQEITQKTHTKTDENSNKMSRQFNRHHGARDRNFDIGDQVQFVNYRYRSKMWLFGKIVSGKGVVWRIHSPTLNSVVSRHSNQIRKYFPIPYQDSTEQVEQPQAQQQPEQFQERQQSPRRVRFADEQNEPLEQVHDVEPRRSTRQRRPAQFLDMDSTKQKYNVINPGNTI